MQALSFCWSRIPAIRTPLQPSVALTPSCAPPLLPAVAMGATRLARSEDGLKEGAERRAYRWAASQQQCRRMNAACH